MKNNSGYPPIKKYMNAVERRLRLPFRIRTRVMSDLMTSVSARHEQGEGYDAIMADLGAPAQVAADLNEEMSAFAYRRSRWRFVCLALAVAGLIWLILSLSFCWFTAHSGSLGIIGGADGPTAIFVTGPSGSVSQLFIVPSLLFFGGLAGYFALRHLRGGGPKE